MVLHAASYEEGGEEDTIRRVEPGGGRSTLRLRIWSRRRPIIAGRYVGRQEQKLRRQGIENTVQYNKYV